MCNKTAIDLAEAGGYIYVAPMGYSTPGWFGSPVINMGGGGRGPGAGPPGPGAPGAARGGAPGSGAGGPGAAACGPGAGPSAAPATTPAPSNEEIAKWSEADVMNVLATMRKEFKIDPKRIYLTGHSMGGAGTLFLASKHADLWAAAAPVAPAAFMMEQTRADYLNGIKKAGLPLMIVQGDADTVVSRNNTRRWADTAKEIGVKDFKYVEQHCIDHGPVITSSQKDIFEFFAAHKKK